MRKNKVNYVVIRMDDCEDHVIATTEPSLKRARKLVAFCRKDDPDGLFTIAKVVEVSRAPRRWRLS